MKFIFGFVTAAVIFAAASYAQDRAKSSISTTTSPFETFMVAGSVDDNGTARRLKIDSEGRVICSPSSQ